MPVPFLVVAIAAVICSIAAWRLFGAWWKYKGRRVVSCPENQRPAGVTVDSRHAIATALGRSPELRLESCSRWPEKGACGQECLSQIEASPEGCLVRSILVSWYAGKSCHLCRVAIGEIPLAGAKPAVLLADGTSVAWSEIPAEELQETLLVASPVCFACHTAREMLQEHAALVSGLSESTGRPVH